MPWHTLTPDETLRQLGSGPSGLDRDEADRRLILHGPNRLQRVAPTAALRILANQFASLVVLLLLAAALVALAFGDVVESIAIAAVLVINTGVGFGVELRARRAMDALLRFEAPVARVLRGGNLELAPSDRLVPGDVIEVEEGDSVPADARLITATALRTDEAPLTGESVPVDKDPAPLPDVDALLAERAPLLYCGTSVTSGRATAVVTHTGTATEIGRIGTLISEVEEAKTPLEVRLDSLGRRLVWLTLGIATFVTALGVVRGAPLGLMIETGIALAIAAVPEGLPVVATIALAVGLRRMAQRNALVRRLFAVEALGSTTVVCTDKTGTLTSGQMTVAAIGTAGRTLTVSQGDASEAADFRDGESSVHPRSEDWLMRLLEACALTSRAKPHPEGGRPTGDPTDAALLVLALRGGVDPVELREMLPQDDEIPFTSERRSSASIHRRGEQRIIFLKGSPATLLEQSSSWATADGEQALKDEVRADFLARNDELADRGLRVIGLASRVGTEEEGLTFLGLAGIVDPPAHGVAETIRTLQNAGIRTVMVTGDQRATAEAIARQLGSVAPGEGSLDGNDLTRMSDDDLADRITDVGVLSRVSPEDKVRIVAALQRRGEVVAMIGDGVNDAPALKKADIGVAMGKRGTDVAKQTAAIVLGDDRFATIGAAVEEGRVIFENIQKFVFYLFSCNLAEVMVLLGASLAGVPLPLLPLQILWLNLVTDTFPALALALEPAEPGVMARLPRKPDDEILSPRFLRAIASYAGLITAVTLTAYAWGLGGGDPARATTVAFMTLALAQLFHLGNARSRGPVLSLSRVFANRWAVGAVPLVLGLQMAAVYWTPLSSILGTIPIAGRDWFAVAALSLVPAGIGQIVEIVQGRRAG